MLEQIVDVPSSVVAIKATGEITGDDYRSVLVPLIEQALAQEQKVRLLFVLSDDVTGFKPSAAWEDAKVGLGHFNRWEKVAVVSNTEWLQKAVDVLGYVIPGQVKAFPASEEGAARDWVGS
jgi:hypothetical protein